MNEQDKIKKARIGNSVKLVLAIAIAWPLSNAVDAAMGIDDKAASLLIFLALFAVVRFLLHIFWPPTRDNEK